MELSKIPARSLTRRVPIWMLFSSSLLEGYDEPEILRSSSRLTSAEAGQVGEVGAEFTKTESADRRAVGRPRVRQSEVVNAMNVQRGFAGVMPAMTTIYG